MKITIYELLGLIKDGKAPKKVRRYRLEFVKDYKLNSHTATVHRTYESEDGTFLMDLVKIDDEVEILDEEDEFNEEDEFIDIEEFKSFITNVGAVNESNIEEYIHILFKQQTALITNQKKIINKLKEEGK